METMLIRLLIGLGLSTGLSLVLTPLVIRFAHMIGAIDLPNERKIHRHPIPRLGGMAVWGSVILSFAILTILDPAHEAWTKLVSIDGILMTGALLIILVVGFLDDLHPLHPGPKFFAQLIAATMFYAAGFRISGISNPFGPNLIHLGYLDYPVTILWIVGVTNSFNLIDGLDGLASGVGAIASVTIFAILLLNGDPSTALIALIITGALFGFLRYNFNPARIFLGDSGSLFIGVALALLSIKSSAKGSTVVAILVPLLALGLPIMDTLLSMVRRFLDSLLPERVPEKFLHKMHSMFLPDRKHIHHQLVSLGLSHRTAVLTLYMVSCAFGLGAFAITVTNNFGASLILLAVAFASIAGVRQLRYKEMAILRNGVLLPIYEWPVINRTIFHGFLDLACSVGAYTLAYNLTIAGNFAPMEKLQITTVLPIMCGIQIGVFYFSGLYQGTIHTPGIDDIIRVIRAVGLSVLIVGAIVALYPKMHFRYNFMFFLMDFYFLITLVAGIRLSYPILNYLFKRETKKGRNVLIYGADNYGVLTLQQILHDDRLELKPIGFLDERPHLEGKRINGYKIFGGHWKLQALLRSYHIDEIILATDDLREEVLGRLRKISKAHGIIIKVPKILLEELPVQQTVQEIHPKQPVPSNGNGDLEKTLVGSSQPMELFPRTQAIMMKKNGDNK
jgi:UDP-GlcNAc:undecaprenyl-phosphate/decaprenyl-phosphate GlcNAc-1-phosphate transferase